MTWGSIFLGNAALLFQLFIQCTRALAPLLLRRPLSKTRRLHALSLESK